MPTKKRIGAGLIILLCIFAAPTLMAQTEVNIPKLQNPISEQYLKANLRKKSPRLVLTSDKVKLLQQKIQTDAAIKNMYAAIRLNVEDIYKQPLLERIQIGRRLLSVSREMLYRANMLGIVYALEKDKIVLARLDKEIQGVCNFSDWNPSHYLDVAEMAMAVAIALDWTAGDLPKTTIELAQQALIEKGIKPSYNPKGNVSWISNDNNWNQVCNGGMIAAAITIAEVDRALAAQTIHRALEGMPNALKMYMPHGIYPEGATYWGYGTGFSVITSSMLESAFGTDFGLAEYPAFWESATVLMLSTAPSGWYYNFADCGDKRDSNGETILAWFAAKTGNRTFYEEDLFLKPAQEMGKLSRLDGAGLAWMAEVDATTATPLPTAWKGDGSNPVVIFKSEVTDPHQYYFGAKGGRGTVNHGNMDGGSFIFELNGVRWSIDPGNQNYHELEKEGFQLWGKCQDCERWTLLTKNNFGHSTLSVNDALHVVDGMASIIDFQAGTQPEATIDLTPTFAGQLQSAQRRFVKTGNQSMLIEDELTLLPETKFITWQMMTTADVEIVKGGAILKQDGKQLKLNNLSHPELSVSVISLYPAPLKLDRQIKGLKRIEIRYPAYLFEAGKGKIRVALEGN